MFLPPDFNWRFYLDSYPDLRNAGLSTEEDAITHYQNHGSRENRRYRFDLPQSFDWEFYCTYNQDIMNAGINTENDAKNHYLTHGFLENRLYTSKIPPDFNWINYIKNYNDLRKNRILTCHDAIEHYIHFGKNEGRIYNKIIKENLKAILCAIALDENIYLDEWIQYHLKLGFDKIVIYDNSEDNEARYFENLYKDRVQIIHFPGGGFIQLKAYSHFLQTVRQSFEYEWGAFIDIDEFIVLKKHKSIIDFLIDHCRQGSLGLNWIIFGSSGEKHYRAEPVLKRFIRRSKYINHHIKSLFCIYDVDTNVPNSHYVNVINGNQHDCHDNIFKGPYNMLHPSDDIACIHHYFSKSWEEYQQKNNRGEINRISTKPKYDKKCFDRHDQNDIVDTSAWDFFISGKS
jgi:hypothetical protein